MWKHDDCAAKATEPGVTRRVLARSEALTMAEIAFEEGASGALHSHPHEQASYVLAGRFLFTIGGMECEVETGDSVLMPPSVPHGVRCLMAGKLLDVFTPARKDFL